MAEADCDALSAAIARSGSPARKTWWERYLKGEIEFTGTATAELRKLVRRWACDVSTGDLLDAAWSMLERPVAEDKLAGLLILQEHVLPAGGMNARRDLARIEELFRSGHVWDWNTTDWLCVRVLGPMIDSQGRAAGDRVLGWASDENLWKKRSALVAFVNLVGREPETYPGLRAGVLEACRTVAGDDRRFAQTAIGWVLREMSEVEPMVVFEFVTAGSSTLSREAVRMAAGRLGPEQRREFGLRPEPRRR